MKAIRCMLLALAVALVPRVAPAQTNISSPGVLYKLTALTNALPPNTTNSALNVRFASTDWTTLDFEIVYAADAAGATDYLKYRDSVDGGYYDTNDFHTLTWTALPGTNCLRTNLVVAPQTQIYEAGNGNAGTNRFLGAYIKARDH
jgi:hypothetical protein